MNITIDDLDKEIKKQLEEFNVEVVKATNESIKESTKEAVKMLRKGGPYQNRTGAYAKNWTSTQRDNEKSVVGINGYTIYNKKHYQITHLLERGHQSRNGGRVKEFSHIIPISEQVEEMIINKIDSKLRG